VWVVAIDRVPLSCAELFANALEVSHLAHDDFDAFENMLAGFCDALESLSMARKDVYPQFFFQLDDRLGNTRLRSVQGLGGLGQIEVAACGLLNKSKLVQVHI
jgi:hypothetical protein